MRFYILERLLEDRSSRLPGQFGSHEEKARRAAANAASILSRSMSGTLASMLAGGGTKNIQGAASTDTLSVDQVCKKRRGRRRRREHSREALTRESASATGLLDHGPVSFK